MAKTLYWAWMRHLQAFLAARPTAPRPPEPRRAG